MRATDLKATRKVRNGEGMSTATAPMTTVPSYLQRYESERDAWLASRAAR